MGNLKNHPGMTLRDDAAAAINALEDEFGIIIINRAGVSREVQQSLIDRWNRGGAANRPPFLYEPKRPAEASEHVRQIAVDVYNYTSDRKKLEKYGFKWYGKNDPVHYTFTGWKGAPASAGASTNESEDDDMIVNIEGKAGHRNGGAYYIANGKGTYLGAKVGGVPTLSSDQADKLASRVQGI